MAKVENEQVVNRFLLSTTYAIVAGLALFFIYDKGISHYFMTMNTVYTVMYILGALGAAWFLVRKFALKKGTMYGFYVCLYVVICALFMRFGNRIPAFNSDYRRVITLAVFTAALYVYELVIYFVNNGKKASKAK